MVDSKARMLTIAHLYPNEMNIYGDTGNVLVLHKRLDKRKISSEVIQVHPGEAIPAHTDIIVSGGGQDKGQIIVKDDLMKRKKNLTAMSNDGIVMLLVCGTYQLFGHRFVTAAQEEIPGIGVFDMETIAKEKRHIGNILIDTGVGDVVGYENHSGMTTLAEGQASFGTVKAGTGNNADDDSEGAIINNTFGTYLHGPILPKNPSFADELLRRALTRKYGEATLSDIDDDFATKAFDIAKGRPR